MGVGGKGGQLSPHPCVRVGGEAGGDGREAGGCLRWTQSSHDRSSLRRSTRRGRSENEATKSCGMPAPSAISIRYVYFVFPQTHFVFFLFFFTATYRGRCAADNTVVFWYWYCLDFHMSSHCSYFFSSSSGQPLTI